MTIKVKEVTAALANAGMRIREVYEGAIEGYVEDHGAGVHIQLTVQVCDSGHVYIERERMMIAPPRESRLNGHPVKVTGSSTEDLHWESMAASAEDVLALVKLAKGEGDGSAGNDRTKGRPNGFPAAAWRGAD